MKPTTITALTLTGLLTAGPAFASPRQTQEQYQFQEQKQQQQQQLTNTNSPTINVAPAAPAAVTVQGAPAPAPAVLPAAPAVVNTTTSVTTAVPADPLLIPYAPVAPPADFYGISCPKPGLSVSGGVGQAGNGFYQGSNSSRTDYTIMAGVHWPFQTDRCREAEQREMERHELRAAVERVRLCREITEADIERDDRLAVCRQEVE